LNHRHADFQSRAICGCSIPSDGNSVKPGREYQSLSRPLSNPSDVTHACDILWQAISIGHVILFAASGIADTRGKDAVEWLVNALVDEINKALEILDVIHSDQIGDNSLPEGIAATDAVFLAEIEEWRKAYDKAGEEDECGPLWDEKCAVVDRIRDRPANTAAGLAVKLLVLSEYGDFSIEDQALQRLLEDAGRIVDVPMPTRMAALNARQGAAA